MTKATWNQKFETLLTDTNSDDWLEKAKAVLQGIKSRSSLSPFLYVSCMTRYLEASEHVAHTPDVVLPVQRFIEYLAAQPERVLFDNPHVYPEPSGLYLMKRLPTFFKDLEDSSGQSALFSRAVAAADQASVKLLDRLGENCGLLQQASTDGFLENTQTYYSVFLRRCRDALMDHGWNPQNKKILHPLWDLYHFKGVSGTPQEQRDEEQTFATLATILPDSFQTIVSFPYAYATSGKEFTPKMLETLASMDMHACHTFTRNRLLGHWCNEKNAGWRVVEQRYPDYALAVDMYHGLLGNMAHMYNMDLMQSLWSEHVVDKRPPPASLALPAEFSADLLVR